MTAVRALFACSLLVWPLGACEQVVSAGARPGPPAATSTPAGGTQTGTDTPSDSTGGSKPGDGDAGESVTASVDGPFVPIPRGEVVP